MVRGLNICLSWISKGLKFKCTQCGKCCKRPDRSVFVNQFEMKNIAEYLGISTDSFWTKYTEKPPHSNKRKLKKQEDGATCIFLENNKCQIHEFRPNECATYPFWPQYVFSEFDWNAEASNMCEGITPVKLPTILEKDQMENSVQDDEIHVDKHAGKVPLSTIMLDPRKYFYSMQTNFITEGLPKWPKKKTKNENKPDKEKENVINENVISEEDISNANEEEIESDIVGEDEILYKLLGDECNESTEFFEFEMLYNLCEEHGMDFVRHYGKDFFHGNKRKIIYENKDLYIINTYLSHEYNPRRALVFKSSPNFVQSEVELTFDSEKKEFRKPDHSKLVQDPYKTMILSIIPLLTEFFTWKGSIYADANERQKVKSKFKICVLGAGCGALPKYLSNFPDKINLNQVMHRKKNKETGETEYVKVPRCFDLEIEAVDIDEKILELGKRYFNFIEDTNLKIVVNDGIEYLKEKPDKYFDIIMVDIAEKSNLINKDFIVPPKRFCTKEFSNLVHAKLDEKGIAVINAVNGIKNLLRVHQIFDRRDHDILAVNLPVNSVYFSRKRSSYMKRNRDEEEFEQRERKGDPWPTQSALGHDFKYFTNRFYLKELEKILKFIHVHHEQFKDGHIGWLERRDFSFIKQKILN